MIIERNKKEVLIRLSATTDTSDLQDLLDYFEYKELVSQSKASDTDIEKISKQVKKSMMDKIRKSKR